MNGYSNYRDELYHHGVLGMKWGVRRYQSYSENPKLSDKASRKAARKAEKKAAKNYNFKKDPSYAKKSKLSKFNQGVRYSNNKFWYGRKNARRIEYAFDKKGTMAGIKETAKSYGKTYIKALVATAAFTAGVYAYKQGILANIMNNAAVNAYSASKGGLNEVKGGFTPGFKAVKNGKKIVDSILGNASKSTSGAKDAIKTVTALTKSSRKMLPG